MGLMAADQPCPVLTPPPPPSPKALPPTPVRARQVTLKTSTA